jgi:cation diffusion facilitator CzcD-associated flavoprotein CzcO
MAPGGSRPRRIRYAEVRWHVTSRSRDVRVAIVGAGFGGIGVALRLRAAGHPNITVYEQSPDVGGVWWHNTYPGVACDAPSHIYSYSFAQDVDWSRRFAAGDEIRSYLRRCVDDAGLADVVRTGTEVVAARWTGMEWDVELADGRHESADVLVPAVGQLTVPSIPDLEGLDTFDGPAFHTARWRHDVDLTHKRVGVVGTGASAIQVIPAIAPQAAQVTIFQRSAPYVFKKNDSTYSNRLHRTYRRLPLLKVAARQSIWSYFEVVTIAFTRWPRALDLLGRIHGRILRSEVPDAALRDKLRPDSRIGCKRILISDDYYATLNRPNVALETGRMVTVTANGITTESGSHDLDVIVFGTGFRTTPFVSSMSIVGRHGVSLADTWAHRAAAFLGMSVPDFPNMFLVYGPNTNLGSGSIVHMLESQADHIVDAVDVISRGPSRTIELKASAFRRYQGDVARRQQRTVWQGCRSWYHDDSGRDTHNWPWLMSTYRWRARRVRPADYWITAGDKRRTSP